MNNNDKYGSNNNSNNVILHGHYRVYRHFMNHYCPLPGIQEVVHFMNHYCPRH